VNLKERLYAKLDKPPVTETTFAGEKVFIKHWSERDVIEWTVLIKSFTDEQKQDNYVRCRAIAHSLSDADGHLIFRTDELDRISEFPSHEVSRVFDEIMACVNADAEDAKKN
jgi:hypothetical protein